MKAQICAVIVTCTIGTPAFLQAGDFEGVIHLKLIPPHSSISTMDYFVKGDRARFERTDSKRQAEFLLMDGQKHTITFLKGKEAIVMDSDTALGGMAKHELEVSSMTVERTGKMEAVAGYPCEVWRVKDKEEKYTVFEACMAKGLDKFGSFIGDSQLAPPNMQPSWMRQLVKEGGFALRLIGYGDMGREDNRMEATSIERKNLDDSVFVAPVNYLRHDMREMMKSK